MTYPICQTCKWLPACQFPAMLEKRGVPAISSCGTHQLVDYDTKLPIDIVTNPITQEMEIV